MCYYRFAGLTRQMGFVALSMSVALIFSEIYVQPRVNAASALLTEDIRIEAPEINLGSVEMKRMVDELKEAGVVSGKVVFVRQKGEVWVDASINLRMDRILLVGSPVFASDDSDPRKAAREALAKFAAAIKELFGK